MANVIGHIAPLGTGAVAPDFTLPHTSQALITPKSMSGDPAVLAFYPMDWEPVSREQLELYQQWLTEIQRLKADLLAISTDHMYSHEAFARDAQIQFPLLSDFRPRGAVAQRYGVYRESAGVSARALFVIDERTVIRFSQVYPDMLNPGVGDLLNVLETLAQERENREQEA